MHALGSYLQEQLDARGWRRAELARRAGISRQQVSKYINQAQLGRALAQSTIEGLAGALEVPESLIERKMWEALGAPVGNPGEHPDDQVPDAVLIERFRRRIELDEQVIPDEQMLRQIRRRFKIGRR